MKDAISKNGLNITVYGVLFIISEKLSSLFMFNVQKHDDISRVSDLLLYFCVLQP